MFSFKSHGAPIAFCLAAFTAGCSPSPTSVSAADPARPAAPPPLKREQEPLPPPAPAPKADPSGQACAERVILLAAKKNVAAAYGNSPTSGGYCAQGVRTSLQRSQVGAVSGSLGNAIDYLRSLPPHGFVDDGGRDPRRAPIGSVLVFSGPRTPAYLKNGHFGKPAGDWLGHVTIKGDDGRYYTDGRTREPAIGWANGVNEAHRRNMEAILVPGAKLAGQYEGKCAALVAEEQAVDLSLAASEAAVLALEDPAARETGLRLRNEGLAILDRAAAGPAAFAEALRLARESVAYDDEGQLAQALAGRLHADPSLLAVADRTFAALPPGHGIEACKTRVLQASLERALCRERLGASGQDGNAPGCGRALSLPQCLATER